jgi:hypothetical protein
MTNWQARAYQPHRSTVIEMKERQSAKIRELKEALVTAGFFTLDGQAEVLGLCRSTTWTILQGNHKASGLSATTVRRVLAAPQLPPFVQVKILEYVEEKAAGRYGHSKTQRRKFIALLSVNQVEQAHLEDSLPLQPEVRLAQGLGALGLLGWRRKRKAAAVIAAA